MTYSCPAGMGRGLISAAPRSGPRGDERRPCPGLASGAAPQTLQSGCVVILGEPGCGKTTETQAKAAATRAAGGHAFYRMVSGLCRSGSLTPRQPARRPGGVVAQPDHPLAGEFDHPERGMTRPRGGAWAILSRKVESAEESHEWGGGRIRGGQ